jgi:thiol-disulfide isomerase/thioredoxin
MHGHLRLALIVPLIPLLASCNDQNARSPAVAASEKPAAEVQVASSSSSRVRVQMVSPDEFKKAVADQKGNVVLVDFWATYCGPCREKFPQTLALGKKYADRGLALISMSLDSPSADDQRKVLKFLQSQDSQAINLANRLEDTDVAFGELDIDGGALPHYKVFDRRGKLKAKFGGNPDRPFDEKDIEAAVVAALNEK